MQADPANQIKPQPTKKCDRTILNRANIIQLKTDQNSERSEMNWPNIGRAKDTSSTTVAGYELAMGTVPYSVDEHTILIGVVWTLAFSSGGVFTAQCLHFSSVLGPRCPRGPELVLIGAVRQLASIIPIKQYSGINE
ncbi:unnamed protein product [Rhizophagus irregularis]|nr:unnamed protein product [Rhizophagus irregularis]